MARTRHTKKKINARCWAAKGRSGARGGRCRAAMGAWGAAAADKNNTCMRPSFSPRNGRTRTVPEGIHAPTNVATPPGGAAQRLPRRRSLRSTCVCFYSFVANRRRIVLILYNCTYLVLVCSGLQVQIKLTKSPRATALLFGLNQRREHYGNSGKQRAMLDQGPNQQQDASSSH